MSEAPAVLLPPTQWRNKIAFLLHSPELLHHFGPVLEHFAPDEVDLLSYNYRQIPDLEARLEALPFAHYPISELLPQRIGYRFLVSNHYQGYVHTTLPGPNGPQLVRLPLLPTLGRYNVRFMYGMGVDQCHFDESNRFYDAFLCFGPWQAQGLAAYPGPKLLMGYPRYDAFFAQKTDRKATLSALGCDPNKPVVVWFSTVQSSFGVLREFASAIASLVPEYNVLVKPHPEGTKSTDFLDAYPFTRVIRDYLDNLLLFQIADYVLCDYGGTVFSALYTDCQLLLLDHPHYQSRTEESATVPNTDLWLRQHLTHLSLDEADQIPTLLRSESHWQAQKQKRQWLRQQFFADHYGSSAQVAAQHLRNLETLLGAQQPAWQRLKAVPDGRA